MSKFGMRDTFDLVFRDGGEVSMFIDSAKEVVLSSNMSRNKLVVVDALVDVDLINDIFNGKHYFRNLNVVGESLVRDVDTLMDKRVNLSIHEIALTKCIFPTGMDTSIVTLEFEFPTYVGNIPNLTFKVVE